MARLGSPHLQWAGIQHFRQQGIGFVNVDNTVTDGLVAIQVGIKILVLGRNNVHRRDAQESRLVNFKERFRSLQVVFVRIREITVTTPATTEGCPRRQIRAQRLRPDSRLVVGIVIDVTQLQH